VTTLVVDHAVVVTVDGADRVIDDGAVAVVDGAIVAVGPSVSVARSYAEAEVVDARGAILMPGLVNAHAHLAMTLFRGLADDRDLDGFLDAMLAAEAAVLDEAAVRAGVTLALAESIRAGCTAALDMYFWPEAAMDIAARAGFRLAAGPVFVSFPGPDARPFAERLAWAADVLASWPGGRWVQPHSTYLVAPDELRAVRELAAATGARVHVHAAETAAEVALVRSRHGRSPIGLLHELGLLDESTTLAHAVALDDDDLALVAASGAAVSHCPLSNLKLASGFCRVPDLVAAGVPVGLGTDGPASSNDLDLFVAMRTAAVVHKARTGDPDVLPASAVLRMATIDAARAVGIADVVGSIEVGKRADLVLLDADSPSLTPSYDAASTVVYAAGRGDVRDVWIDGRRVLRDRALTTIDLAAALDGVRARQGAVRAAVSYDRRP
jgi:5-methylthioadenosine/S-adenosylhomocysteine deaminase